MKKRAMLLLALTAIITGVIGYPLNANAEEETTGASVLSIEASTNKLDYGVLATGNSYTKTLTITNHGANQTTFSLSVANPQSLTGDSDYASITEWITLTGGVDYTLAADASTNVSIRVKVPKDAVAGGQYAALIASNTNDDTITLTTISAIVSGDDLRYGGEVTGSDASWFNPSSEITSFVSVKNNGNVAFDADYKFTVKSIFGGDPIHEETSSDTMYPGSASEIHADWTSAPAIGLYNVSQSVTYINADGEIVEHTTERVVIMCPIWLLIVIGIAIIAIIVIVIVVAKKRGKKSRKGSKKASWEKSEDLE